MSQEISREQRSSLKFKKIKRRPGALNIAPEDVPQQKSTPSPAHLSETSLITWLSQNSEPRPPFTKETSMTPGDFRFYNQNNPSSGCFGTVFKVAHNSFPDMLMAMKLIKLKREATQMTHLLRELSILARCSHENIVKWYGSTIGPNNNNDCLILMEFMSGGQLEDAVLRSGRFSIGVLNGIMKSTISGLHYLKTEISTAHRDIKPSNILVSLDGRVVLCDFGMSKIINHSNPTFTKFVGSRIYMSPEMLDEEEDSIDYYKSDTFSLGVTIIECAYGFYPIPMVLESEVVAHLEQWRPAERRPRTSSCENLAMIDDQEQEHIYMERKIEYQPFELLQFLNESELQIVKNSRFFPEGFSDFVNSLTCKECDRRPSYEELMKDPYFKSIGDNTTEIAAWAQKVQAM